MINLPANRTLWLPDTTSSIKINGNPVKAIYSLGQTTLEKENENINIDTILRAVRDQFGHQIVGFDMDMNFIFDMFVDGKRTSCRAQLHPVVGEYMEIKDVREVSR